MDGCVEHPVVREDTVSVFSSARGHLRLPQITPYGLFPTHPRLFVSFRSVYQEEHGVTVK